MPVENDTRYNMDPHRLSSLKSKLSNICKSTLIGGIVFILINITITKCSENSTVSTFAASNLTSDPIRFNTNQSSSPIRKNTKLLQKKILEHLANQEDPTEKPKYDFKTQNFTQIIGSSAEISNAKIHRVPEVNISNNEIIDYSIKNNVKVTTVEEYVNSTGKLGKRNKEIEHNIRKLEAVSLDNGINSSNNITEVNLQDVGPEKRRHKRKNSIDRIGEYPHGYDHGLIIHHHLPPRLAIPVTPDHHYYSYPGRIPRRPDKPGPVYLGPPKAPKIENYYYKDLLPDTGSAKTHSLPSLFQPIPRKNVHGKNYQHQYHSVQHPTPKLKDSIGYQIHHEVETPSYQPITSQPYNYSPTTPSPSYNYNPTTPPKVSHKPFVLIKTQPTVETNIPGIYSSDIEAFSDHPPFTHRKKNAVPEVEVSYKPNENGNEGYVKGYSEVSINESDLVESNIDLRNFPEHFDNSDKRPSRLTLEEVYSATPVAALDRDTLTPTTASKLQIQDVVGTVLPEAISTDDLIYLKESYNENLIFTNLTSPKDKFDGTEKIFLVNFIENLQESDERLFPELTQAPRDEKSGFAEYGEVVLRDQLSLNEDRKEKEEFVKVSKGLQREKIGLKYRGRNVIKPSANLKQAEIQNENSATTSKPVSNTASYKEAAVQNILSTAALGDGSTDSNEDIQYEGSNLLDESFSKPKTNISIHLPALPKRPHTQSTFTPGTNLNKSSQYSSPDSEIQFVEPVNSISSPHISTTSIPNTHVKNDGKLANLQQPSGNIAIQSVPSVPTFADNIHASNHPKSFGNPNTPFNTLLDEDIENSFQTHPTPPFNLAHNYQFQQIGRSKPSMFFSTHKPPISSHSTPPVYHQPSTAKPYLQINHHGTSLQYQKHPTLDNLHHVQHHIQQHPTPTIPTIVPPHFDTPTSFATPVVRPFVSLLPIETPVYPPQATQGIEYQNFFPTASPISVLPPVSTIFPGSFSDAVSSPPLNNAVIHPPPPSAISPFLKSHSSLPTNLKGTRSYMFSTIDGAATYAYNVADGIVNSDLGVKSDLQKVAGDQSIQPIESANVTVSGNNRPRKMFSKVRRKGRRRLKARIRPATTTAALSQSIIRHGIIQGDKLNKPPNHINPKNQRLTTTPNSLNLQKRPFPNFEKQNSADFTTTTAPSSSVLSTTRSTNFVSRFRQPKQHIPDPRTAHFAFQSTKVKSARRPKERRPHIPRKQRIKKVKKKPFTAFRALGKGVSGFIPSTRNTTTRTNNILSKKTPIATTSTFSTIVTKPTRPIFSTTSINDLAKNTISTTFAAAPVTSNSTSIPEEGEATIVLLETSTYVPNKSEAVDVIEINKSNIEYAEDYILPDDTDEPEQDSVNIVVVPGAVLKITPEDSIDFKLPRNPKDYPDMLDTTVELGLPKTPKTLSPFSDPQLEIDLPNRPNANHVTSGNVDYLDLPIKPEIPNEFSESSIDLEPPKDPSKNPTIRDIMLLLNLPKKPESEDDLSYTLINQDLPNNPSETSIDFDYNANYDLPRNPNDVVSLDDQSSFEYEVPGTSKPDITTNLSVLLPMKPEVFSGMSETSIEDEALNDINLISSFNKKTDDSINESFPNSLDEVSENQPFAKESNGILSIPTQTVISERSKFSQNSPDSTDDTKAVSSNTSNPKLATGRNKQIKTTMKTISTLEMKDKNVLMSKILDALAQSIHHPLKDEVVKKLKEEFASPSKNVKKPLSIVKNNVPQAIRISKELRVLKDINGTSSNFTKESQNFLDEFDYDFSTTLDSLDEDGNKMKNNALLDNVVDKARVVLFNRLREGVNVEDAIRVSLQPHLVNIVQPHIAKQVEDRIHFTYKDQVFVGKEHWIDSSLSLSAQPDRGAFLSSTTIPFSPNATKTTEEKELQSSALIITTSVSKKEDKEDTVLNDKAIIRNSKKARQNLDHITTQKPKFTTATIITPNPRTTLLPFESTKIQLQTEKQLVSQRLSANNLAQEKDIDKKVDGEIEVFNGVSVIQIPFPQLQKKTEATVNLPDFQEIPKHSATKTNIKKTNKISIASENHLSSKRRKILDGQRTSPRVKADHLKFLRDKFKTKTGRKTNLKRPKFKNKKEKEKAIKFIIETLRKQRKQLKSSNVFIATTSSTLLTDSNSQTASSPSTTSSKVAKTTTDGIVPDETTYFPIPTDDSSGETTYFPIHTSKDTSIKLKESTTTPITTFIPSTTSSTPNLPLFTTLPTPVSDRIVSFSTTSNLNDTTPPTTSMSTTFVSSSKSSISQDGIVTSPMADTALTTHRNSFESSEERTTSIPETLSVGLKVETGEVTAASAQLFDLISFEDLHSTTTSSNTNNHLVSEPLEIIRSSVILSQNHRNVNRDFSPLVGRAFPQFSPKSVVRSPNNSFIRQNMNINTDDTNIDDTTPSNMKDDIFETGEIPMSDGI